MKKIMKLITLITIILLGFKFSVISTYASPSNDLIVTCHYHGPCDMIPFSGDNIFGEDNILPGDSFYHKITVVNEDRENDCRDLALTITRYNSNPAEFAGKLFTAIKQDGLAIVGNESGGEADFGYSIQDLFNTTTINFDHSVPASGTSIIDWYVTFDKYSNNYYRLARTEFDFNMVFTCNSYESATQLFIEKSNDTGGASRKPGDLVLYTLVIKTKDINVNDVDVVDLPPSGFKYQGASWTAFSDKRGDLKTGGITGEPVYSPTGKWYLGDMEAEETVTLTYLARIEDFVDNGTYPDLAWAVGEYASSPVYANAGSSPKYFVGTQVIVDTNAIFSMSYKTGMVAGASTSILPATGANGLWLILGGVLTISGLILTGLGIKLRRKNV